MLLLFVINFLLINSIHFLAIKDTICNISLAIYHFILIKDYFLLRNDSQSPQIIKT